MLDISKISSVAKVTSVLSSKQEEIFFNRINFLVLVFKNIGEGFFGKGSTFWREGNNFIRNTYQIVL